MQNHISLSLVVMSYAVAAMVILTTVSVALLEIVK